ncbi:hypothetical protein N7714_03760 [Pseudomonas aeruginosa]|uniref:hypothetical protein n=1 Tax=Pseudomonas aeruginosa TaxID=287 RepID=UPI00244A3F29|nr:hypothetical protein [Pseudomonas aeruginosa]MDG9800863.1 hypothetical protein [Pseudomonas aeruginosa]MDG9904918.1 hypothetical protein [Pseudomonas aeruginosa]MDH0001552.1 hypothetical protein [Pseudomonas aeruginosa]MDH0009404.1 hypothetical protein [Pseudomonas aeruginosa]MDH0594815.1 hypothetical protein [Pseudomonas aeruginosa]
MIKNDSQAPSCTCPSGDGSLVHPCPAHPAEQAEAERSALWAVHAQGPDELYAAFSREDAEKHAAELNALPMPEGIAVGAVVVPSPWPAVQHWQYLAEQEQDHKNEIAGRLRQLERICEGLAQVEALRAELQSQRERNTELIFKLGSATNGWGRCEKERDAALARVAEFKAQAQHSVPDGWKLVPVEPTPEMLDARRDCEDGMDGYLVEDTEYYFPGRDAVRAFLARVYRGLIAAAPAPGGER